MKKFGALAALAIVSACVQDNNVTGLAADRAASVNAGAAAVAPDAPGAVQPISVTVHGNVVYVLNAGGAGNVSGFRLTNDGLLEPITGSTRSLSGSAAGPAQVSFSPSGQWLVVTEKATSRLDLFAVGT